MAILIVEDDFFYANQLAEILSDSGVDSVIVRSVEDAMAVDPKTFDAAIIDIMLPNDPSASGISVEESRGGFMAGIPLARKLTKDRPNLKLALITSNVLNSEAEQWAETRNIPLLWKYESLATITDSLKNAGILAVKSLPPRAFIVHGHDEVALLQLKNYLQNVLGWREPVVLREQASCGRTILEKFEEFSTRVDCVFVLLTPDDAIVSGSPDALRRSRQNVIFELGFFYSHFGRQSGRVIVLYKGPNELPSDIHGIVWIDVDRGIEVAGEQIRREVARFTSFS